MRAFQHLTVAMEHVLSTVLRPPRLPPKTEVLASREVLERGVHQSLTLADAAAFKGGPITMLTPGH